ncbi:hypothetical protein KKB18_02750 [bacterium]|nr:hypothetical protein [bacterium]
MILHHAIIAAGEGKGENSEGGYAEFTHTSLTLKMSLFAAGISYSQGDNLTISLIINNFGPGETENLYFILLVPNGTICSGLDWSDTIHPAVENITIPAGFTMPLLGVVNVVLPSDNPPKLMSGKYYFR